MKKIGILGSTGSIGTQTLEVVEKQPEKYKVEYLSAKSNASLLCSQAKKFNVKSICILDDSLYVIYVFTDRVFKISIFLNLFLYLTSYFWKLELDDISEATKYSIYSKLEVSL